MLNEMLVAVGGVTACLAAAVLTEWVELCAAIGVSASAADRLMGSWIWQNLKRDVLNVEGTPCVAESGATGNLR